MLLSCSNTDQLNDSNTSMDMLTSCIIGELYDSVLGNRTWSEVLSKIARAVGVRVACMIEISDDLEIIQSFTSGSSHLHQEIIESLEEVLSKTGRLREIQAISRDSILVGFDEISFDLSREVKHKIQGLKDGYISCVSGRTEHKFFLFLFGKNDNRISKVDVLRILKPISNHIDRVLYIMSTAQVPLVRRPLFDPILDRIKFGVLLIDKDLNLEIANEPARVLLQEYGIDSSQKDRIVFIDGERNKQLEDTVQEALESDEGSAVLVLRGDVGVLVAEISKINSLQLSEHVFIEPKERLMICLSSPNPSELEFNDLQRMELDLTATEWKVATSLARGMSTKEIAQLSGSLPQTVRWHIKQILAKTNTSRQPEIVRLLLDMQSPVSQFSKS